MKDLIAYCGLDCEICDARTATLNNDDVLREKVAKKWTEMNGINITTDMINCEGCRCDGVKTVYCDSLCEIRQCAIKKEYKTCGYCHDISNCKKVAMILNNNEKARKNLKLTD